MFSVCVCVYVFLCLCTGRGLATSWSPVQGVLPTVPDQETEETALCSKSGCKFPSVGATRKKKKNWKQWATAQIPLLSINQLNPWTEVFAVFCKMTSTLKLRSNYMTPTKSLEQNSATRSSTSWTHPDMLYKLMSEEAQFHFFGYVNKQKFRNWKDERPTEVYA
jgi:hypothetical protein